ncbi:MAG: spore coat protein CotJB [Clostridia bacterium]|nr:spore coat protein CotJB [Clostridia bacterium]
MTANQNTMMEKIMAVRFSVWDLHLYLDSHPCDKTAMELLEKYKEKNAVLTAEYESRFGPLTPSSGSGEEWTKAPWPWQMVGDC